MQPLGHGRTGEQATLSSTLEASMAIPSRMTRQATMFFVPEAVDAFNSRQILT